MPEARFPDQRDLFAEQPPTSRRGRLFTIAPGAPFLATLADRVIDGALLAGWPREGPFWLTDVTIILPTRRARLALAQTFLDRGHPLLPDIRTFGGEAESEEPFLPPHDAPDFPAAISATARRLTLATLIDSWARTPGGVEVLATSPNAAEIIGLANSLGEVIDDLEIEGVSYSALRAVPPENLAANWQKILQFLDIALDFWPRRLAAGGQVDAVAIRNLRLRRQAASLGAIFGDRPVIAAGSTGSIPATGDLLKAIAALERGAIVLPGLDTSLTPTQHAALLREDATPHGHPQYGLAKLLRRLDAGPGEVVELASDDSPRTLVVREALSLAEDTAQWAVARGRLAPQIPAASEGLGIIAAHTADEEARAIALCARHALNGNQTVGIVSPDQNLSRRIGAELLRFGIEVDDPAGTPLFQSPAGRLVRVALAVAESHFAPVELIALLRNKATTLGMPRREMARLTDRIELCLLRGQRLRPGMAGLREALAAQADETRWGPRLNPAEREAAGLLFDRLEATLAPFAEAQQKSAALAQTVAAAFRAISAPPEGAAAEPVPGAKELAAWAEDLAAHPDEGPSLLRGGLDSVLYTLMRGRIVRSTARRRDDIFIWGLLEARLQSPDLTILAGLNEGVWPRAADPGPWLNRAMRLGLGLEPPERRQGQAAHDFEMALGNRNAIIAYARRLGTSPALPSRFVQRLQAFLGAGLTHDIERRGAVWLDAARRLDVSTAFGRAPRPAPRPPVEKRPAKLSVTEVETLLRSPYDLYAKHTLRLRKLAPLGEAPDARDRGSIVHDVFARFIEEGHHVNAPEALAILQALAVEAFSALEVIAARRDIWLRRFQGAARQFLSFEKARESGVLKRFAETPGSWALPIGFTLTGRADRIDLMADGTAEVIDFKTGSIPQTGDMTGFLAPQLPLEAAMLRAGAWEGIGPAESSALTYIKVGLGPEAFVPTAYKTRQDQSLMEAAEEMARRLQTQVTALLLSENLPMMSRVFPIPDTPQRRFRGDYDHLGRVDEWSMNEGDESE